ncbi:MAG: hypothetical protein JNM17_13980 [Archangium sp.]|nr:hypothetical protein [Archangium sp.]
MRRSRWVLLGLFVGFTSYGAIHAHPQPLFANELTVGTIVVHSRDPLPANATELLREVESRLQRSPLYRADVKHHVFICDTPALYAFFNPHHPDTGGETYFWLGNQVFLRPVDFAGDRLISPLGTPVAAPRTLVYFLTHELTHAMTMDAVGLWNYLSIDRWKHDGYADFVALPDFDVEDAREKLRSGDASMDYAQSGLYRRWQLDVHDALSSGVTVEQLLTP